LLSENKSISLLFPFEFFIPVMTIDRNFQNANAAQGRDGIKNSLSGCDDKTCCNFRKSVIDYQ